ncbi:TPR domain protein [Syntrophotalea carbinolica DSM 2380]|uniref:TPR domain protein n=1 Tax=Syntrophotalea carbinolica (strain DSM 2380 / NBRC 103641 / GraBd1) TaxID=338963 RepID=Q3A4C1_SYNC1|nr:hypothetical protein [Syntrophotalea carbinolica]ABA88786.1 TPR domain protein [Syntrophotalea carbinolica DSM 2380]
MNRVGFALLLLMFSWAPCSGFFNVWWSDFFVCLFPFIALLLLIYEHRHDTSGIRLPEGSNALLVLAVFGLIQLVPIPPQLLRLLSPNAWEIYQQTVGILQGESWLPLTLAPRATLGSLFLLIACWAAYTVTANLLAQRKQLKVVAGVLASIGGGLAGGILVLWVMNAVFGFLPSRNGIQLVLSPQHAAIVTTFMLMICPLSLSLFLTDRPSVRYGTWKERLSEFFVTFGQRRYFIYGLPAIAIPLAVATYWREGLMVLFIAILLMLIFLGLRSRGRRESPYLFIYLFMILILAISLPLAGSVQPDPVRTAAVQGKAFPEPLVSRQVVSDFALTGAGFGSFSAISKRYRQPSEPHVTHGASVQRIFRLASQSGLIGFGLAGWFLFVFIRRTFRKWLQRRQKLSVYLYAAGMGSLFVFILGYFSTGGLSFNGFFILLFMFFGVLAAATESSVQATAPDKPHRLRWVLTSALTILAVLLSGYFYIGDPVGQKLYSAARNSASEATEARETSRDLIALASFFDPLNPRYRYVRGYQAMDMNDEHGALKHFADGMRLDPLGGRSLYGLGQYFFNAGNSVVAENLILAALDSDPSSREFQSGYVEQLVNTQKQTEALSLIRGFIESSPEDTLFWVQQVINYGIDGSHRSEILPDLSRSHHDYGLYLMQHGDINKADGAFRKALALARQEQYPDKSIFLPMAHFFERYQGYDDALDTLMVASSKYPQDLNFLLAKGRIYQEMGITFKARKVYQDVLILNPTNQEARQRLNLLEGVL